MKFHPHLDSCNGQAGQALIEALFSFLLLFLSFFVAVEIIRLVAYKTMLQTITSSVARQISHAHLELLNRGVIPNEKGTFESNDAKFRNQIADQIAKELGNMQTTLFSFDDKNEDQTDQGVLYLKKNVADVFVQFVNQADPKSKLSSGVYLKVNSCLPVLFSSYFRRIAKEKSMEIGKKSGPQDQNRNCLGEFSASNLEPLFWFRVRAAAYTPWPASSEIYSKGYAFPKNLYGLEQEPRQDVSRGVLELNLTRFFSNGPK